MIKVLFLVFCLQITGVSLIWAQDELEHLWLTEEKDAKILVYKTGDGRFYGKISWLRDPDRDGKPKTDIYNPDKARKNDPELGLIILKGFRKNSHFTYDDGTIYDPKSGKTYNCKITIEGDRLFVRGFVGISLFGKTTTWTKADQ